MGREQLHSCSFFYASYFLENVHTFIICLKSILLQADKQSNKYFSMLLSTCLYKLKSASSNSGSEG